LVQIEAETLDTLPKMRVIDPPSLGVERIDHLEEVVLPACRLGRRVQRRRPRMLARYREMTEDNTRGTCADLGPDRGAMGTTEIGVDDQQLSLPACVVGGAGRRDRGAGQVGGQAPTDARPSKITLAPGISSGVGDS
jgi:hypothetical protein